MHSEAVQRFWGRRPQVDCEAAKKIAIKKAIDQLREDIARSKRSFSGNGAYKFALYCGVVSDPSAFELPIWENDAPARAVAIYDDGKGAALIARARRGDTLADALLCDIACAISATSKLPPNLHNYISGRLKKPLTAHRGKSFLSNYQRDLAIFFAIAGLTECGLRVSRNPGSEGPSASSLISKALKGMDIKLSERSIFDIWSKRRRFQEIWCGRIAPGKV